ISLLSLTGCANLTSPARDHALTPGVPYWMDYDASRRGTLVIPRPDGTGVTVCAEPSPDIALNLVTSILADVQLNNPNVDPKVQLEFQQSVVELTQRSETISFLRESLYRMCEQSMNGNLSSADVKELYEIALKTSLALAQADATKQQSKLAETLKDPAVRALWDKFMQDTPAASQPPAVPAPAKKP
ncbi:MAG: hypothetical protein ACRD3W_32395, partial [Terriglobales bacterium]